MPRNPAITDTCIEPGCDKLPHSRNLCTTHYYRHKKAGTLPPKLIEITGSKEKPRRKQRTLWAAAECTETGCTSEPRARDLCSLHYQRHRQAGTLPPKVRKPLAGVPCRVDGCAAKATAREMCQRHYTRSMRYGYSADELPALDAHAGCEACGGPGPFHVDHEHATGITRGVLCAGCNTALGLLGESVPRIVGLLAYLVKYQTVG